MTYIEKEEYYYVNRVLIVKSMGDIVKGTMLNLDTGQHTPARIGFEEFQRRYELSDIQIR